MDAITNFAVITNVVNKKKVHCLCAYVGSFLDATTQLQIKGVIEDKSKIIFLISQ